MCVSWEENGVRGRRFLKVDLVVPPVGLVTLGTLPTADGRQDGDGWF